MVVLYEAQLTWTGFGLIGTSLARSSLDVNPWWPYNKENCQNYAEVTNCNLLQLIDSNDSHERVVIWS